MIDFKSIEAVDPELCGAMRKELTRQREELELIAFCQRRCSGRDGFSPDQ